MLDVAIVGAGPVGAVAASLCATYGLTAAAFDREADVYELPRAAALYDDVQRILHGAGVLDAILPATCELVGAEFVDAGWKRIIGFEVPQGLRTPNGYPPLLNINQPPLERAIRSCLDGRPGVALHASHDVLGFTQHDDHVELEVLDRTADRTRRVRARWLIGCDGATSPTRKACGIAWESLGYDCDWLVIDLELTRDVPLTPLCQQVCDPARPTTLVPLPGRLRRWEFQLKPGETREEMQRPERVWSLLEPWLAPGDGEIVRAVVYRFHATIASTFRNRRVFLAGDAAHQTPPFQGQGLCTGVRDVENLIWKLAAVRRGQATESLLDTYTAERRPLAVAMVEHSTKTGQLIDIYAAMAAGGPPPSPEMQEYAYGGSRRLPDMSEGLLALDARDGAAGDDRVGRPLPLARVSTARGDGPFDDVVGPRWAIVARGAPGALLAEESRRFLAGLDAVEVSAGEPGDPALLAALGDEVALVRPDRIVYGIAPAARADALVRRLHEHLQMPHRECAA